ncbi:MAG: YopX family protein [Clostridia bacterium]
MREILFRGKRESDGKWLYGIYSDDYVNDTDFPCIFPLRSEYDDGDWSVIRETVGQYTGLTDKNGKKIFEGDIVKADGYIFVVKFGKCGGVANAENYGYIGFYFEAFSKDTKLAAEYGLRDDICYFTDIEVIGNIYDKPELLEVAK